jgi:hypothetical protein
MGSLATQGGASNALAAYGGVNPWAEAARGVADGAYLKFNGNLGDITFGSDDTELPVGSRIVVDMSSFALGWTCWAESQVVEEILVPVVDGKPPLEHELTDHGPYDDDDDGWRESASISAVISSYGTDEQDEAIGTKLLFKTSTGGAVRSLEEALGRLRPRVHAAPRRVPGRGTSRGQLHPEEQEAREEVRADLQDRRLGDRGRDGIARSCRRRRRARLRAGTRSTQACTAGAPGPDRRRRRGACSPSSPRPGTRGRGRGSAGSAPSCRSRAGRGRGACSPSPTCPGTRGRGRGSSGSPSSCRSRTRGRGRGSSGSPSSLGSRTRGRGRGSSGSSPSSSRAGCR